ncbi:glycosyltransferase [Amycolatopsis sp. WAC 01375]|uniref:TIGR04282 family arsenosugar biosynthesis glycosyltransferase n=1 Tax=Amycolatopsis sp. WAC 01375 TaxID=2203194 RepID=UPI000F781136|nr:TIGR04282 family arsenosugar biosynthesis glycosyltransferase [Amycolatopsis sp. WAC 01375]RSM81374.1 glycosyltransferase [Amycolatopsis sp. WAC 01375]
MTFCLLIVAKAPVPGFAKTRLCPPATPEQAAEIAAASLLDTLEAALLTPKARVVVAMTGELAHAARGTEVAAVLRKTEVLPQRGEGFDLRLVNAHADAPRPGEPVLQIGMDTPQVTPALLAEAANRPEDSVLGPAEDGGWWALGLKDPLHAKALAGVPMSRDDTGRQTLRALTEVGLRPGILPELSDVDTITDARRVALAAPRGRFARAVAEVR